MIVRSSRIAGALQVQSQERGSGGGVGHLRTRGCHTANKMFAFLHRYLPHTASWRGHLWQNYSAKVV